MNKEQVKKLFKRIKANFDKFSASEPKFEEWLNVLKEYSDDGVNHMLDQYLKDGNTEPPMCATLISEFIKVKTYKRMLACKYCNQKFEENDLDNLYSHEDRCRSIEYIKSKEHLINKNFDKKQLLDFSDEQFNKFYDIFLKQIKVLNDDGSFNLNNYTLIGDKLC